MWNYSEAVSNLIKIAGDTSKEKQVQDAIYLSEEIAKIEGPEAGPKAEPEAEPDEYEKYRGQIRILPKDDREFRIGIDNLKKQLGAAKRKLSKGSDIQIKIESLKGKKRFLEKLSKKLPEQEEITLQKLENELKEAETQIKEIRREISIYVGSFIAIKRDDIATSLRNEKSNENEQLHRAQIAELYEMQIDKIISNICFAFENRSIPIIKKLPEMFFAETEADLVSGVERKQINKEKIKEFVIDTFRAAFEKNETSFFAKNILNDIYKLCVIKYVDPKRIEYKRFNELSKSVFKNLFLKTGAYTGGHLNLVVNSITETIAKSLSRFGSPVSITEKVEGEKSHITVPKAGVSNFIEDIVRLNYSIVNKSMKERLRVSQVVSEFLFKKGTSSGTLSFEMGEPISSYDKIDSNKSKATVTPEKVNVSYTAEVRELIKGKLATGEKKKGESVEEIENRKKIEKEKQTNVFSLVWDKNVNVEAIPPPVLEHYEKIDITAPYTDIEAENVELTDDVIKDHQKKFLLKDIYLLMKVNSRISIMTIKLKINDKDFIVKIVKDKNKKTITATNETKKIASTYRQSLKMMKNIISSKRKYG